MPPSLICCRWTVAAKTGTAIATNFVCAASVYIDRAAFSVKVGIMKTTLPLKSSMHQASSRGAFLLIPILLACFGLAPMAQAVGPDTDGNIPGSNNGEGIGVLVSRTSGIWNTGTGFEALNQLTSGNQNTATGLRALFHDISGGYNTATGVYSLFGNLTGFFNSATGGYALAQNTIGSNNTANGYGALYDNWGGNFNTATGSAAAYHNRFGTANTAIGDNALVNTTGGNNTAIGSGALGNSTTGNDNTALGIGAGGGVTTANQVIAIGATGANVDFSCFIGHIRGVTTANADAVPVLIDSDGQLGTVSSSRRFKSEIRAMDNASKAILALKPVTFHYKSDKTGTPQFGLIAEEVAEINPDLVVRDEDGEIYSVRYEAVNAMLLNEFLKEHKTVQEQGATIAELKKEIAALTATVKEQAAQIQKVSAQLDVRRPAPQTALNIQ
jgi:hypothetical protein